MEIVRCLADVLAYDSDTIEHKHLVGAAGQVAVAKAFPELMLNGRIYQKGDGGYDYLNARIDTKTAIRNSYKPTLWIKRSAIESGISCVYIGVVMENYENIDSMDSWNADIYGFATLSYLRVLMDSSRYIRSSHKNIVGFREKLYPPSILKLYLKLRGSGNQDRLLSFLTPDDISDLNSALSCLSSNTDLKLRLISR